MVNYAGVALQGMFSRPVDHNLGIKSNRWIFENVSQVRSKNYEFKRTNVK